MMGVREGCPVWYEREATADVVSAVFSPAVSWNDQNRDAKLLVGCRVLGRHQPPLDHEGKADRTGVVSVAGSLQQSYKYTAVQALQQ